MLTVAKKNPQENRWLIEEFARQPLGIRTGSTPVGKKSGTSPSRPTGLEIDGKLMSIPSRFLAQPNLTFGGHHTMNLAQLLANHKKGHKASWDLQTVTNNSQAKFYNCMEYSKLKILQVHTGGKWGKKMENDVKPFADSFVTALKGYGIKTDVFNYKTDFRDFLVPTVNRNLSISEACVQRRKLIKDGLDKALKEVGSPYLVFIILPSQDARTFSDIKRWADCCQGVKSICVLPKVLTKAAKDASFLANLSLKLNFKFGGTNHRLEKDWYGAKENTRIVGADVSHVTRDSESTTPSMAGMVATCDAGSGQYLASARLQSNNTESIAGLASMIEERLPAFEKWSHGLPEHILFYRDGVIESQYGMIIDEDIPRVRNGCIAAGKTLGNPNWTPKITLLVVGKRHHTRFSPQPRDKADANIDHDVIHPSQFSFYLQSHDSPLGTARSGHYVVLLNESGYTASQLQETTHGICFTGSRSTTSLSICTPARYADILCDRLRAYMRPVLSEKYQVKRSDVNNPPTLGGHRSDALIWARPEEKDGNPWHEELNNEMFYL